MKRGRPFGVFGFDVGAPREKQFHGFTACTCDCEMQRCRVITIGEINLRSPIKQRFDPAELP